MPHQKDYSQLTLEELRKEEKKIKKSETLNAVLVGFALGIMVYGVVKKGGIAFINVFFPMFLIFLFARNSKNLKQKLKQIQAEINNKNTN